MALLIDSSVFISLERHKGTLRMLASVARGEEPIAMAAITASELLAGALRADSPQRRDRRLAFVEALFEEIPVLPFDLVAARVHARIWMQLASAGKLIGNHDLLIAATVVAHGSSILTENIREFARIPGLDVQRPTWGIA